MPFRKVVLAQDQIYHIYNRGVAALPIFHSLKDYSRFLNLVTYYRFINVSSSFSQFMKVAREEREKILEGLNKEKALNAEILAFCLMPNHFHFLLKQLTEKGISTFMANIQNGYAKYLNIRTNRVGPLFQSMFKVVRVDTDEQLIHVSRYIHLNPSTGYLVEPKNLLEYPWSSLGSYVNNGKSQAFIQTDAVLGLLKTKQSYHEFVLDQADYQKDLDKIKHLTLE